MSDLLPANAVEQERDISRAIERAANLPTPVRDVWNPDTCPANMLAWLAWAFSVDEWGADWTDAQKRDVIRSSVRVHRYKGTIGAVREALAALGVEPEVQEWFNQAPAATPYTFRIALKTGQTGLPASSVQKILRIVDGTKNLRSHLDGVQLHVQSTSQLFMGAVTCSGHEYLIEAAASGNVIINGNVINLGA